MCFSDDTCFESGTLFVLNMIMTGKCMLCIHVTRRIYILKSANFQPTCRNCSLLKTVVICSLLSEILRRLCSENAH